MRSPLLQQSCNKLQTREQEFKEILKIMGSLKTPKQVWIPSNHEVIIAIKRARIVYNS